MCSGGGNPEKRCSVSGVSRRRRVGRGASPRALRRQRRTVRNGLQRRTTAFGVLTSIVVAGSRSPPARCWVSAASAAPLRRGTSGAPPRTGVAVGGGRGVSSAGAAAGGGARVGGGGGGGPRAARAAP